MYVPALLAEGKVLYRDAWFTYGPASARLNGHLFRLFGVHSERALLGRLSFCTGSLIFLYLAGMRQSSWMVGWTAAAILWQRHFILPYSAFPCHTLLRPFAGAWWDAGPREWAAMVQTSSPSHWSCYRRTALSTPPLSAVEVTAMLPSLPQRYHCIERSP